MNKELTEQEDDVEKLVKIHKLANDEFVKYKEFEENINPQHFLDSFTKGYKAAQSKQKESSERVYTEAEMKLAWDNGNQYHRGSLITASQFTFKKTINSLNKT